jgi:chromosome segregation ATPase
LFYFENYIFFRFANKVREVFRAPENVPRLVDLVKVKDESLKTAFYHYMHDTLVAEDMEQVNQFSKFLFTSIRKNAT